jgi:hypothetical protein
VALVPGVVQPEGGRDGPDRWSGWNKTTCDEDIRLINNRQNGRRRGRGGGPRPSGGGPNPGNRQDNRSRGNAAQLLEKYKSLARDSQLSGDRVQTEYYLQFADHYYRVLNENRARFEDQRPRQGDYGDEDEDGEEMAAGADGDEEQAEQPQREFRSDRGDREGRGPRREHREPRDARDPREQREPVAESAELPQREDRNGEGSLSRRLRPRRDRSERGDVRAEAPAANDEAEERISLDVLPPAIAPVGGDEEDAPKPRRRARRPRPEGETEIAPAA